MSVSKLLGTLLGALLLSAPSPAYGMIPAPGSSYDIPSLAAPGHVAHAAPVSPASGLVARAGPLVRPRIVKLAESQLGVPYVWGAESPGVGFDCSGLVQWVYAQVGIELPRVSADQGRAGTVIGLDGLRPADLVLWDNSSRNVGADHVAIFIGNGELIEAPYPGALVRRTTLYDTELAWGVRLSL